MQRILSVENMRKSDAYTIAGGISGTELMMRAGRAVYEAVDWKPPVAVVCGSGNNAGDGYVIAALLHDNGIRCDIIPAGDRFSEDGQYYFDKCAEKGIPVIRWEEALLKTDTDKQKERAGYSTIVDCIYGTGFHGELEEKTAGIIEAINKSGAYTVSVDINSGLNGDSGMAGDNGCVVSDLTVSIGSYKPGHFLNMGKDVMKRKINCDIGIEPVDPPFFLTEKKDFARLFTPRKEFSNKGDYGYIALIGGSKRYSGAVRLAYMANASMRAGAGVVKVAVPDSLSAVVASNILESTLFPLSDDNGEIVFKEGEFEELIKNVRTVAFGMGAGVSDETGKALKYLLEKFTGTLVIDADGLTLLSRMGEEVTANTSAKLVLTPHMKEFSRLTGKTVAQILASPVETAREFAAERRVILLLKGPSTIITDGNTLYITDSGCSGMATAGSGDVLSGILAAVCAYLPGKPDADGKEITLVSVVAAGAYINGRAGELACQKTNPVSMTAGDTVSCIAGAVSELL